ncbi:cytochrome P450 monooxygenase pc-1 [Coprinopsis marcescibilis]|uniref:Cytochrome P450 monooxygenase pc-1 n=1 Tax=Coprinopsis marcescibilis TaxID=230819 RepID=A0A5C3L2L6_COPMA|nr:cytochrome P450 monooxygenase pc-1 [Coprinopsis marcescibilis]
MTLLTPGVRFLSRGLAYASILFGGVIGATRVAHSKGIFVPLWMALAGAVFAGPAFVGLYITAGELKKKRRAAQLGARVVPKANGKKFGNLDVLEDALKNMKVGYPGDGLDAILEAKGPVINLWVLWSDSIISVCPDHIKTILATDFQNYVKGERFIANMGSVLGTGVFNSDGEMWKFHRGITRPIFTKDRIADFDMFDHHAEIVIGKLKERLRQGYAVDFQDVMLRFTLDTATQFLFGHCVNSLEANLPYPHFAPEHLRNIQDGPTGRAANAFAEAFMAAQEAISNRERIGWISPLFEIRKDPTEEPMKIVNAYIEPIVKEAILRKQNAPPLDDKEKEEAVKGQSLIDHLIDLTTDPVVLRDETLNELILAGRDTTASTLTFCMYLLSQHPHVYERLRKEILDRVGPNRRPTFEDLKDLKYLRAVLNETLRLFPIVPFNIRESINETTWVSPDPNQKPLYIPAGTKTGYSVFMMHRRKELWGPDAEEFDPDRFLDERVKKYLVKNSFIFLPFNAGPRICLGQQYAYNEMSFMMIRLMQNFSGASFHQDSVPPEGHVPRAWKSAPGRKSIENVFPKLHLTMYAGGGLWLRLDEAESSES